MNKEQIIDEAYESFMLQNGFKYENGLLVGKMGGLNQLNVTYWLTNFGTTTNSLNINDIKATI